MKAQLIAGIIQNRTLYLSRIQPYRITLGAETTSMVNTPGKSDMT